MEPIDNVLGFFTDDIVLGAELFQLSVKYSTPEFSYLIFTEVKICFVVICRRRLLVIPLGIAAADETGHQY